MNEYIDLDEIPRSQGTGKWPCDEWDRDIPEDKALEITDLLNGQKPGIARVSVSEAIRRKALPLKVLLRGDRLFITRKP